MTTAIDRLEDIVGQITYKPGWEFAIRWNLYAVILTVTATFPDIGNPGQSIKVSMVKSFDEGVICSMSDEEILDYCLFESIREVEHHEMMEWFKYKGVCVKDPHPEK